jgi:hypothetical protein
MTDKPRPKGKGRLGSSLPLGPGAFPRPGSPGGPPQIKHYVRERAQPAGSAIGITTVRGSIERDPLGAAPPVRSLAGKRRVEQVTGLPFAFELGVA